MSICSRRATGVRKIENSVKTFLDSNSWHLFQEGRPSLGRNGRGHGSGSLTGTPRGVSPAAALLGNWRESGRTEELGCAPFRAKVVSGLLPSSGTLGEKEGGPPPAFRARGKLTAAQSLRDKCFLKAHLGCLSEGGSSSR